MNPPTFQTKAVQSENTGDVRNRQPHLRMKPPAIPTKPGKMRSVLWETEPTERIALGQITLPPICEWAD